MRVLKIALPKNSYDRAEKKDVKLVDQIIAAFGDYKPQEAIKGLQIVL